MSQMSNDCKGITYVSNDAGQILFSRPPLTSTGMLVSSQVVVNAVNWKLTDAVQSFYLASQVTTNTGATID